VSKIEQAILDRKKSMLGSEQTKKLIKQKFSRYDAQADSDEEDHKSSSSDGDAD
jgi:hypothetical protein